MRNRILSSGTACDYVSASEREAYQAEALRRVFSKCLRRPLIAPRVPKVSRHAMRNPAEFIQQISPANSEDHGGAIRKVGPYADAPSRDPNARIVFSTSGSSGKGRLLLTSYQEIINNAYIHGKGYAACGIAFGDTVATFGEVGQFASEFAVIAALSATGCTIIPIVERMNVEQNSKLFADLGVNVLLAMQRVVGLSRLLGGACRQGARHQAYRDRRRTSDIACARPAAVCVWR